MVNHVVSREELEDFSTNMAEHIAKQPMVGLKLAKQSVNQMQDAQGFGQPCRLPCLYNIWAMLMNVWFTRALLSQRMKNQAAGQEGKTEQILVIESIRI